MWNQRVFFSVTVLFMLLCCKEIFGRGPTCLSCDKVVLPRDCSHVTVCGDHEVCYVSKDVTDDGLVWYNVGCKAQTRCQHGLSVVGKRFDDISFEQEDVTSLCSSCCSGDMCNQKGCGATERPQSEGTLCYKCLQQSHPNTCDDIALCGVDQSCYIESTSFGSDKFYTTGCKPKTDCHNSALSTCCDIQLCNNVISTTGGHTTSQNVVTHSTAPPAKISTTQSPYVTQTTHHVNSAHCPYPWLSHETSKYCVLLLEGKMTLTDARAKCKAYRMHLPIIETPEEQDYLKSVLEPIHVTIWLDGTDEEVEGHWIWYSNGQPINYLNWSPGQPDHYYGIHRENCMEYGPEYMMMWNDAPCFNNSRTNHVVCESSLQAHVPACPTDWLRTDHHLYCVMNFTDSWFAARNVCSSMSSHLPVADTEDSFTRIEKLVGRNHDIWLDGTDEQNNNNWIWSSTGVSFTYIHWAEGEPNDYKGNPEHCLEVVARTQWKWNDAPCDEKGRVDKLVCERFDIANQDIVG